MLRALRPSVFHLYLERRHSLHPGGSLCETLNSLCKHCLGVRTTGEYSREPAQNRQDVSGGLPSRPLACTLSALTYDDSIDQSCTCAVKLERTPQSAKRARQRSALRDTAVRGRVCLRCSTVALHLRTALRPHPSLLPCQIPTGRNSKHRVFDWRRAAGAEITCQDGSNRVRIYFRDVLPYSPRVVSQRIPATRRRFLSLTH